jgi:hypothetical protein
MTTTTTEKPLLAFHNDPAIKKKYLDRVRKHREADQLVQGYGYWQDGKGCAVGCTLHSGKHSDYPRLLGIPEVLSYLQDRLFEGLPVEAARAWPEAFYNAIKEGSDLKLVWPRFAHWLLIDPEFGVIKYASTPDTKSAIEKIADLFDRWIAGNKPADDEWALAALAADLAAARADLAAARAAARAAALAADLADLAADLAALAADLAAKRHYSAMSQRLIVLLKESSTAPL